MLTAAAPAAVNASVRNLISLFMIVVPLSRLHYGREARL